MLSILTVIICSLMHGTALGKGQLNMAAVVGHVGRISDAFQKGEPLGRTLLDLSKALDGVSHGIVLE